VDEKDCNVTLEFFSDTVQRDLRLLRKAKKRKLYNATHFYLEDKQKCLFERQAEEAHEAIEETLFADTMPATEITNHDHDLWAGIDTRRLAENLRIAADFIRNKVR